VATLVSSEEPPWRRRNTAYSALNRRHLYAWGLSTSATTSAARTLESAGRSLSLHVLDTAVKHSKMHSQILDAVQLFCIKPGQPLGGAMTSFKGSLAMGSSAHTC